MGLNIKNILQTAVGGGGGGSEHPPKKPVSAPGGWGRMAALEVSSQESHLASLAGHPFVSLESASQLVSAGDCLWPVGRHLRPVGHRLYGWVNGTHTFMNGQS